MSPHTFKKEERLKSRKVIGKLFQKGHSFGIYPLRLVWLPMESRLSIYPVQFTLSVPKKKIPKAVHRNHLRRMIREAYRLNKHRLYEALKDEETQFAFMMLYVAKEPFSFREIESAMQKTILRFIKKWKASKEATNRP